MGRKVTLQFSDCMNYSAVASDKLLDPCIYLSPLLDLCIVSALHHYMRLFIPSINMPLTRPLVIQSPFLVPYAIKHVHHWYKEKQCFAITWRLTFAEFTTRLKLLRICHGHHFTTLFKFIVNQQLTKLSDFIREPGEFLSLFSSLLSTV